MRLFREGKVKKVFEVDERTLEFQFTNNISVFDKIIPTEIPYKGEVLCRTSAFWFKLLEENGIRSDFLRLTGRDRMLVKRVEVIPDYSRLSNETTNYLIPLEFICRHYNAGSLNDRVKEGKVPVERLGFPKGHQLRYGERLPTPFFEATTKLEETDRNLSDEEAMRISGLTPKDYQEVLDTIARIDALIAERAQMAGLIHVDGKKEFAYDEERRLMIVDTFGTLDEDRWWDVEEYAKGNCVELSKEMVRQHYRETGYHEKLYRARKEGRPEPDIPPLPREVAEKVSRLYIDMYERMTGERFQ
ncbi:MAG: phosphoribosylaminoimidazolesuccinocarboxamide synthase [Methanomassiliicoccales archaeon]|nr:phosphoribosylaminoimidazolesuccinocarboxamide synthase [Methanomassiliicoccales archaeon]